MREGSPSSPSTGGEGAQTDEPRSTIAIVLEMEDGSAGEEAELGEEVEAGREVEAGEEVEAGREVELGEEVEAGREVEAGDSGGDPASAGSSAGHSDPTVEEGEPVEDSVEDPMEDLIDRSRGFGCAFASEYCDEVATFAPREGFFHVGVWDAGRCAGNDTDMCPQNGRPVGYSEYTIDPSEASCDAGEEYHCEEVRIGGDCVLSYHYHYCD